MRLGCTLSQIKVNKFAACNLTEGGLIAWNKTNYIVNTAKERIIEINETKICNNGYHVFPLSVPTLTRKHALEICSKVGQKAKLIQPPTEDVYNAIKYIKKTGLI